MTYELPQEDCNYSVRKASDDVCKLGIQFNKFSKPAAVKVDELRGCIEVGAETFCAGDDDLVEGDIRSTVFLKLETFVTHKKICNNDIFLQNYQAEQIVPTDL